MTSATHTDSRRPFRLLPPPPSSFTGTLKTRRQHDALFLCSDVFLSKFLCSGLIVQGPSEGHLQPVHSGQPDPWEVVTWISSGGGGDTYLLRASRESHPTAARVQSQKNPSHFAFLLGKVFGEDGVTAGGSALCKHMGQRNKAGGIQTLVTSGRWPQCVCGRSRRAEKQSPADHFRRQLCFPI